MSEINNEIVQIAEDAFLAEKQQLVDSGCFSSKVHSKLAIRAALIAAAPAIIAAEREACARALEAKAKTLNGSYAIKTLMEMAQELRARTQEPAT